MRKARPARMKSSALNLYQDEGLSEDDVYVGQSEVTSGFKTTKTLAANRYPFRVVKYEPTETHGMVFIRGEEPKMSMLKKRFREKVEKAKRLREEIGDPIALGRSIIEIPEEKSDQLISQHKGYKYVSKKS
jgi:hypothetical protein